MLKHLWGANCDISSRVIERRKPDLPMKAVYCDNKGSIYWKDIIRIEEVECWNHYYGGRSSFATRYIIIDSTEGECDCEGFSNFLGFSTEDNPAQEDIWSERALNRFSVWATRRLEREEWAKRRAEGDRSLTRRLKNFLNLKGGR